MGTPTSGDKKKHEKGVWGFMVHVLGSCWSCRDHVGPFWAYVGQFGGCSWPILANFVAGKAPQQQEVVVEVLLTPPRGHVGPTSGDKMKHEKGVLSFMVHLLGSCWPCRDHVGPF